ncbi:MAG: FxDxF family PEP-CTERM protein [Caulobacteraceae bacterium]
MRLNVLFSLAAIGCFAAASLPAAAQTYVPVGTLPSMSQSAFFYLTSGTPYTSTITADFGDTITGSSTPFDDIFEFQIPQDGVGSGSLSTSFSSPSNLLTISQVLIDGVSYGLTTTPSGESLTVNGIPIINNALNTIEVIGTTGASSQAGTFTGTATFTSAAPEPASWLLMIGGVGLAGAFLRRRSPLLQLA